MGAREKDLNPDTFIGLKLPMGYSDSGYFKQTKTTLQQAKYNIINLIKTIPGERLGQPSFGSNLHSILFEPMNEDFNDVLEDGIRTSMSTWLPYINVKTIEIDFPDHNVNRVDINIDFGLSFEPDRFGTVSVSFDQFESAVKE
jgi:phage baseplate assembly protein W|tara:strand:- start:9540 stop:9968 length:429 start_codon:yes stop_codon:yes gene_type:complete